MDAHSDVGPRCPSRQSGEGSPHPSCLPFPGWSFNMGSAYEFHSWRVFIIVCALPCVCSVVALTFMPESPRFLLEVTLIITNTQRNRIQWNESLLILGKYVCLFGGTFFLPTTEPWRVWFHGVMLSTTSMWKSCLVARKH